MAQLGSKGKDNALKKHLRNVGFFVGEVSEQAG